MRAISLWQPWASLWLSPAKVHETRHWPILKDWEHHVPFLLAVHAAKKKISENLDSDLTSICEEQFGRYWREWMSKGAIIGIVIIEASHMVRYTRPAHDSDRICGWWEPGRFAWRRGRYCTINPVPYVGRQGIFNIPDVIVEAK